MASGVIWVSLNGRRSKTKRKRLARMMIGVCYLFLATIHTPTVGSIAPPPSQCCSKIGERQERIGWVGVCVLVVLACDAGLQGRSAKAWHPELVCKHTMLSTLTRWFRRYMRAYLSPTDSVDRTPRSAGSKTASRLLSSHETAPRSAACSTRSSVPISNASISAGLVVSSTLASALEHCQLAPLPSCRMLDAALIRLWLGCCSSLVLVHRVRFELLLLELPILELPILELPILGAGWNWQGSSHDRNDRRHFPPPELQDQKTEPWKEKAQC